ncbi:hypothetical protein Tsubulata_000919, partial [Turnera subulata]
ASFSLYRAIKLLYLMQPESGSRSGSGSVSSPTGSRLRKKHKRLDAICEQLYNQNHRDSIEAKADSELRRSSRVRRPPVLLDASPSPAKRRRKVDKKLSICVEAEEEEEEEEEESDADVSGSWRARLRSSGKRKLFYDVGAKEKEKEKMEEEELNGGDPMAGKPKRQGGRVKIINELGCGENGVDVRDSLENEHKAHAPGLGSSEVGLGIEDALPFGLDSANEAKEKERLDDPDLVNIVAAADDIMDYHVKQQHDSDHPEEVGTGIDDKKNKSDDAIEVVVSLTNEAAADGGNCGGDEVVLEDVREKPMEEDQKNHESNGNDAAANTHGRTQIKPGRRCGLCGCSNDGKPPKRVVQDAGDSENEAYGGSSDSEDATYDPWDGFGDEPGWLGRLLGPVNDRYGIAGIWVHQQCAVWSPEARLFLGRALKCSCCGRPGATIGCRVDRCPKTYHLPCARASSCIFDHRKFLIACTEHRHLFQPHGHQLLMRMKKLKAKKMRLDMRKLSNDAWRKDVEAEERWLENCGEDEEFLKRESKRLQRDMLRIAPVYIGGSDSECGKLFEGWESVAGLQGVIQCMKEVVLLPLLYPEFFSNLGITPPRGVLLHGYPGTGKTLVVRALIGSCARGDKRIAYFARKGADCLGKYVGDAERQLRLLFQVAERSQPSIIFFDEIDGLAPSRTRQQDQTHSSVVSTLLALMDGLKSRGSVVVIGATNRPEAVDPALRRPGRFDREIYFPLPSVKDRAAIISLHTRRWPKPVSGPLLEWIATRTVGFAGADLQALCTQAAMIALKRNFPLQQILSAAGEKALGRKCSPCPSFVVEDRDWLEALACAPSPCSQREAGIAAYDLASSPLPTHLVPFLLRPLSNLLVSLYLHDYLWLPPTLLKAATMVKDVIISSLEKNNLPGDHWWSHVDNFLKDAEVAKEIQRKLKHAGLLIGEVRNSSGNTGTNGSDDDSGTFESSAVHSGGIHIDLLSGTPFASRKKSGFRILISGTPRGGQRHLAACIVHSFVGNVEIQKIDLATVSQEGHGDMIQGLTQILMKCAQFQSCMIFMPRIDLWAIEMCHQVADCHACIINHQLSDEKVSWKRQSQAIDKENHSMHHCEATELAQPQDLTRIASRVWSSLVEQVESLCVSTSLMILGTSEIPYAELPGGIRQFFEKDFSNGAQLNCLEGTLPRFAVDIDQNFNHDEVISASADEMLSNMVQSFVQLIHQRAHIHTTSLNSYEISNGSQGDSDAPNKNHLLAETEGQLHSPRDPSKLAQPSNYRSLKGKSSLLLAMSTFGYQILRYPHFAELCWVTSKLKEGPCADVSGPWKGWPFNSCVIRPCNSSDRVTVVCNPIGVKNKERSGLVRGLIAVGLLAYRGVYKSLEEVCFEVRKVLELLVGEVNEKIHAGKDRYQYVRLLSQVAYLEDVINSWAYALQSFEVDTQMQVANANPNTIEVSNTNTGGDDSGQSGRRDCNECSHQPEQLEVNPRGLDYEHLEDVELNEGENDFCSPISEEGKAALSEDGPTQPVAFCDHKDSDQQPWNSTADNEVAANIQNQQNDTTLEPEDKGVPSLAGGSSEFLIPSSGFSLTELVDASENVPFSSEEQDAVRFSGPMNSCNHSSGLVATEGEMRSTDCKEHCEKMNSSTSETCIISSDRDILCAYRCCSGCVNTLHNLIEKILTREWEFNRNRWTIEDVHDAVASLSVELLLGVRRIGIAGSINYSFGENNGDKIHSGRVRNSSHSRNCQCIGRNIGSLAQECSCHTMAGFATNNANHQNSQSGPHPNYVFRDGVLFPMAPEEVVRFHCEFDNLCLCPVIDSVAMIKQPFD